ncbi:MAG: penicillin acylase family protein [Gemmatimonadota bacterium]
MALLLRYVLPLVAPLGLAASTPPPAPSADSGAPAARSVEAPGPAAADSASEAAIARRVEIVRTRYGVPHVMAEDLEAMGFALGWLQSEDYGEVPALNLVKARGEYARFVGPDSIDDDFEARVRHARARETWSRLEPGTREVYQGFAAGVNHYLRLHAEAFPDWLTPDFTGIDALAREVQSWSRSDARRFVESLTEPDPGPGAGADRDAATRAAAGPSPADESFLLDGSNAWAFAPSRTVSRNAILLRNPHLSWDAGYYEAHVRVPGVVEFYGDFRIGSAFGIIGGFNERLGWATTNNSPTLSQVYALARDPADRTRYLLDGESHPVMEEPVTVSYRTEEGELASETRVTRTTPHGPVIHETGSTFYILKDPRDGEFRRGEQFLRMMQARSLEEWTDVMEMRAHPSSNFTYADVVGNIVHYYNARLPRLPHPPTGDTAAVARSVADMWSELVPFGDLPFWINPPGGYLQQANDTPDYSNLLVKVDRDTLPPNLPAPRLRLRSQHSLLLAHGDRRLTLEDMVTLKHSTRVLMANRVVDELVREARKPFIGDIRPSYLLDAATVLELWDRTAGIYSRGATLFSIWADLYLEATGPDGAYRVPWNANSPLSTPYGLGDPAAATRALAAAVDTMVARGWPLDGTWGEVHRVVRGDVNVPVQGCPAVLGCFRVLSFEPSADGRLQANRGDGWVLAVEFDEDGPRALSVLAYGQSNEPSSPHFDDQAALFARGQLKPVAWTDEEIRAQEIRRYRPG